MRSHIRLISTLVTAGLVILAGYTIEIAADELGWAMFVRAAIRDGWSAMGDAGYDQYVVWSIFFSLGVTLTLWIDFLVKRYDFGQRAETMLSRLQKKLKIVDGFGIGWSRSGDNPLELSEIGFEVQNLTGKPISNIQVHGTSIRGDRNFPVKISTQKKQYALNEIESIAPGSRFSISLDLRDHDLFKEMHAQTDPDKLLEGLVERANNRRSGMNGMYVEPFLRTYHGVRFTIKNDGKEQTVDFDAKQIRSKIAEAEDRDIDRSKDDGIVTRKVTDEAAAPLSPLGTEQETPP